LNFCSSDHANAAKRPKLKLCYTIISDIASHDAPVATFSIYPNPAHGVITLSLQSSVTGENLQVNILNLQGQTVYHGVVLPGEHNIDVSHLSSGLYICHVRSQSGAGSAQKLVIR